MALVATTPLVPRDVLNSPAMDSIAGDLDRNSRRILRFALGRFVRPSFLFLTHTVCPQGVA